MKETIDKNILTYDKSTYTLKLIKIRSRSFYVEIAQTIHGSEENVNSIKINPSVLPDVIEALQDYKQILDEAFIIGAKYISKTDQQKVQDRYLKGVSIKDIALQIGKSEELIETILRNRNIEIVSNEMPKEWINKGKRR